ncbi:MAG: hypothetical protein R2765_12280 [Ferruginibacter sp.]
MPKLLASAISSKLHSNKLNFVDNYKPYDKAGAYAIQEWIGGGYQINRR